ncbi:MAG TPA: chromosome segregation protein SMC, partial [Chthoniobacterales bacterium]|nr:chromosome segregation protein SMC [Chthoniobacterales bacterium]
MADVIFSGTDTRKPLGFAEVSLTFTDCSAELGVDWHEVRVTRRVYRDGNSDYLLNKTLCRLKDIHSLFADTGIGRTAYSIMEQGKIDLILSSRPEDRRSVFEEAAGITKYKTQKREALRKLEATEANLLRIGDIIKEVKRQIGSLQRQAGKARRYQALLTDLRVLDTHHSQRKLRELEAELEHCRGEIERFSEKERATLEQIEARENELASRRSEVDALDVRVSEARGEVQRLQSEISAHRSRIEFNRQRAEEIRELIERYTRDIEAAEARRTEQAAQIEEADALIQHTTHLLEAKEVELAELSTKAGSLRAQRADRETELQALELALTKAENRIAALTNEIGGTKSRRESTGARLAELATEISRAMQARDEAQARVQEAKSAQEAEEQTVERLFQRVREAEQELHAQQQAVAEEEKQVVRIERTIAEKQSRLEILRQLNEEGEGLAKGSQAILKGLDQPDRIRPALAGALVSNLNVDREFIPALEAAFGRNMHAVVLQEPELAAEILHQVTSNTLGQAALALPQLTPAATDDHLIDLPQGAIAWAIDKLDAPAALAPLVRRLLRGVVIVPDLPTALRLKREHSVLQFATLAGEFISTAGVVFGGSANNTATSLLGRNVLIAETANELQQLEGHIARAVWIREEKKAAAAAASHALEEARREHQAAHLAHGNSAAQILLLDHQLRAAEDRLRQLQTEQTTLEQQTGLADERIAQLEAELALLSATVAEQQGRLITIREACEQTRMHEEETTELLQALRLGLATERQRYESLVSQRQPMAARERELCELIDARRADIANYERRLELQQIETEQAEASLETQTTELAAAEENVATIAQERARRLAAVNQLEAELRATRSSLNELHDARGQEQVRETQVQLRVENLLEHIARRYQVDLREFESDHYAFQKTLRVQTKGSPEESAEIDAARVEAFIADLTRQLDNMGPVNLDAVQEYDELEERHRFLEAQNNDLLASKKELLEVIAKINSTTQKLFADTFAQVRINFREMFAELFGGGRADLSLVDENDPLECGIDITAKPPGKQLQSVSLLSGGEKTMTAVALLFAIYMVRPSPFCILDQMDAPLDESNINRFIKVLERFVQQSQFIIITHNKRTIAKADVLYGVTMEERGVSKLVGMRLASEKGSDGQLRAPLRNAATQS